MKYKKQLTFLYLYSLASNLRITDAVWVVFLTLRGFALWQVGLAEGVFHAVSLMAEIPSGMVADLLGRRRTLALSGLMAAACGITMAFAPDLGTVCLAMAFKALSYNLISGTQEALAYDSLKMLGREGEYLQIDANVSQFQTLGCIVGNMASLLVRWLSDSGFYLLESILGMTRTLAAMGLKEPIVTAQQAARSGQSLRTLPARLAVHTRQTVDFLHAQPAVTAMILANAVICLPQYLATMFLQQRLAGLGWPTAWLGLPMLAISLAYMLGTAIGRRQSPRTLRRYYAGWAVVSGLGCLSAGAAPLPWALAGAIALSAASSAWMLHSEKWLNDAYPSDQRATLVSVDGMAYSLLMIPTSPLVGAVGDRTGAPGAGICLLGVLVLASAAVVFCSGSWGRKRS